MAELLTSAQNPKFKRLVALREKSRLRRDEGVFVVEGRRELEHCEENLHALLRAMEREPCFRSAKLLAVLSITTSQRKEEHI